MTMKTESYNFDWCIINIEEHFIHFFNKTRHTFNHGVDTSVMIDVGFFIDDMNIIHISGKELIWEYSDKPINVDDLKLNQQPADISIKHSDEIKLFGITFSKPFDYIEGWYALRKTNNVSYIFNWYEYNIKISD